jgi:hypothetical protein
MHENAPTSEERMIAEEMFCAMPPILRAIEKDLVDRGVDVGASTVLRKWNDSLDLYRRGQWFRLPKCERQQRLKRIERQIIECDVIYFVEEKGHATYREVRLFSYARISYSNLLDHGMEAFLESEQHRLRVKKELGA